MCGTNHFAAVGIVISLIIVTASDVKNRGTTKTYPQSDMGSSNCSSPPICACLHIDEKLIANCTARGITPTTIPKFSDNVTIAFLDSNKLNEMPNNTVAKLGSQLHSLHLQRNNMSAIHVGAFRGLYNLVYLDLSENQLTTKPDVFTEGVFKDLQQLQILHLQQNSNQDQKPVAYPDKACSDLMSLTNLSIDGQVGGIFGPGFGVLKNLVHLNFAGYSTVCNIHILENTTFYHLSHLHTIDASQCRIVDIELGTFSSLHNLTHLLLSNNDMLQFKALSNITQDLVYTTIEVLELNKIHKTFGLGTMLYINNIKSLVNTSLQVLRLDSNRIELFQLGVLSLMPKTLKEITIADNKLTFGLYMFEGQHSVVGLQLLNASHQYTSHDPRYISIQQAIESEVSIPVSNPALMAGTTSTQNLVTLFGKAEDNCIPLPQNLKIVDVTSSDLKYNLPYNCFEPNSLKQLILADNIFYEWIGPIKGLAALEFFDLSNNFCSEVSDFFFDTFPNLTTLYIQKNVLGFSMRLDHNGNIFKSLSKLKNLDISNNRIDILPPTIFRGLLDLEQLVMSNNSLTECSFRIDHMGKLEILDLSFNQLHTLPIPITDFVDKQKNISVNIKGNPFVCSCETLDFIEWFQKRRSVFMFSEDYSCKYNDYSQKLKEINLTELKKKCTSYLGLIIGTVVGILVVAFVVVAGLVYRFRWKLRHVYYMAKNRKNMGYTPVQHDDSGYVYDAFIAYSDVQRKFVVNDMIQHLEKEAGLSLCVHHRDFLPGNEIAANITDAIHNSRKTVAIVSRDFFQSYWCMFELNMARMESIYSRDGRNNLFLVMYETDIPPHLPLEFYDLIESNSYIEYPDDPQGNVVFWNKVRESLA